jgi:galactose-1-phosphate uridylyltransferase
MKLKSVFQQRIQGVTVISAFWQTIRTMIHRLAFTSRYFVTAVNNLGTNASHNHRQLVLIPVISETNYSKK